MADTLLLLRLEHHRTAELLKVMEAQIELLKDGEKPDHQLLRSMMDYLSGYPDQCHHPKEDLLFEKLQKRDPAAVRDMSNLLDEHKELARLTGCLAGLVDKIPKQSGVSAEVLKNAMQHYVDAYYHHMDVEEKYFFPTAMDVLTSDDWAELDFSVFDQTDPLVGEAKEVEFGKLLDEITQLSKKREQLRRTKVLLKKETDQVHLLTSVARFNETETANGTQFHLSKVNDGSYELKAKERLLAVIPQCDEKCAAWCAHYFLIAKQPHH